MTSTDVRTYNKAASNSQHWHALVLQERHSKENDRAYKSINVKKSQKSQPKLRFKSINFKNCRHNVTTNSGEKL